MGAEVQWTVRVLKYVEETVEISAVTETEAMERADKLPGVAIVLGVRDPSEELS